MIAAVFLSVWAVVSLGACGALAQNLVVNGDFEDGNVGFVSDHWYYAPPAPYPLVPGQKLHLPQAYTVDTDPGLWLSLWTSYADHTSGSGNMMVINAADTSVDCSVTVWETEVPIAVQPHRSYEFSYWVALAFADNPPELQVSVRRCRW